MRCYAHAGVYRKTAVAASQHLFSIGGFCTQAAMSDIPNWMVRETTGHTSDAMLNVYSRPIKRRKIPSLL
jgi:hypothetical protein